MGHLTEKSSGDKLHRLTLSGIRPIEPIPKALSSLPFMIYRNCEGKSAGSSDGITSWAVANSPHDSVMTDASMAQKERRSLPPAICTQMYAVVLM